MLDNLYLLITAGLIVLAFFTGRWAESRQYQSIKLRERKFLNCPAMTSKTLDESRQIAKVKLVVGSVVVSIDYFKRFLAQFRLFFGGELRSYSSVLDRGKREAMLRMKESCPDADLYVNCRMETSTISSGGGDSIGSVEIVAYGTAIKFQQ